MKYKIYLLLLFLFGIGLLSNAQQPAKKDKPVILQGADVVPITVKSTKKAKKISKTKFIAPIIVKDSTIFIPPKIVKNK